LVSNPAKNAIVIGRSDREHGPRLVIRPLKKIINRLSGPGLIRPWLSICSLLRARSDNVRSRKEIG